MKKAHAEALPLPVEMDEPLTAAEAEEFDRLAAAAIVNNKPHEPFSVVNDLQNAQVAQQRMFTAPPVTGYRALTEAEVGMMNRIKKMGAQTEALVFEINAHIDAQHDRARYFLADDSRVIVRPSGTEPKLKVYLEVVEPVTGDDLRGARERASQRLAGIRADLEAATAL